MSDATPMMAQYRRLKAQHRHAILFFRLGDFYEMFEEDARAASKLLDLTLTQRNGVPMCGVPYHAAATYTARLLRAGHKIAICEQKPGAGKELMGREVVEVLTPGTIVDQALLAEGKNNYLLCLADGQKSVGEAFVDLSTGQLSATGFPFAQAGELIRGEFLRLAPSEILVQESLLERLPPLARLVSERKGLVVNRLPDWSFDWKSTAERVERQFAVSGLHGLGFQEGAPEVRCVGVILEYLEETARSLLPHIRSIRRFSQSSHVVLNESTQRNLELVQNLGDGSTRFTLYELLNKTRTAMGARKLREWILEPLRDATEIGRRLDVVEWLYRSQLLLSRVRDALSGVYDLERLASRIAMEKAHAKDLLAVGASLVAVASLAAAEAQSRAVRPAGGGAPGSEPVGPGEALHVLANLSAGLEEVRLLIERSVAEEPSILLSEGNLIRRGCDAELDRLHGLKENARGVLAELVERERRASGIASLKLRYNRVIGHFLEVTKANLGSVPSHYVRRQSMAGAERFSTEELAGIESELASAEERIVELERAIFLRVRAEVRARVGELLDLAGAVSRLDVLAAFAHAATVHGYTRPTLHEDNRLVIREGRHPVVEANLEGSAFVPNSLELGVGGTSFIMLTGPNMAGKSTFLRQVALVALLAQIGCFVPAAEAQVGLVDAIYCRVGASDNLARGESTFLVEMSETAHILRSASARSLLVFDEVGRGTSTRDGLAIAWAVAEHIVKSIGGRTLFATHFHELTRLVHPAFRNMSMDVVEEGGRVVFLKRIREGPADQSYGVHVAKLAGVPQEVIDAAQRMLDEAREVAEGPSPGRRSPREPAASLRGRGARPERDPKCRRGSHASPGGPERRCEVEAGARGAAGMSRGP
jgi:DNA mismatch repair protein MutS